MSERTAITTAQMVQDRRLVRLFAAVGKAVHADENDDEFNLRAALLAMREDLLGIAPEFLPPFTDDEHDPEDWQRWRELIEEAESA